ncbi:MAG: hypothetical protein KAJ44_00745, partial [Thermoplasmatales archaeon]|nr:hypothetical protein [Thermoplasmatales archaeon]
EGNNLIKKGVVVAVILLFVSVSVIPSTANPSTVVDVELRGRIGVIITIKNIGNETVNILDWYLSVKGGHFGLINKSKKGNVTLFEPGDKIIKRFFVFGFGFLTISFCIIGSPSEPGQPWWLITGREDMFVFGPYVYQRP